MENPQTTDFAPDPKQKMALSIMSVLVLLTFAITNLQAILWQSSQILVGTILPAVVVTLTNEERSDINAQPLRRSATLDAAAKLKAEHMAKNQYFAHFAPDGTTPWHWFDEAGYVYAHAGENLAIHFTDSDEVVEAWMNSPSHKANIVSGKFTEIGVATAKGTYDGFDTVYVVQLFGTPAIVSPLSTPATLPVVSQAETVAEATVVESTEVPAVAAAEIQTQSTLDDIVEESTVDKEIAEEAVALELETTTTAEPVPVEEPLYVENELMTTSSGLEPAQMTDESVVEQAPFIALATQPNKIMQIMYTFMAIAVLILLILSFVDEARLAHPVQMSYSAALIVMMIGLYWVHTTLTQGAIVV
jgi:hypothetical protein